jgi:uncharacterized coiled-coil protein SlyX
MPHETKSLSLEQRVTNTENWLKWLLRAASVTLAGLLAFAFWLGTISAKVSSSEQTINKVYSAVSEDPNSLLVRTSVIEHRLTGIETQLTKVESRLTGVEDRLTKVENKLTSMDAKLNELIIRFDRGERRYR